MDSEDQLKVQAFLDGELPEKEAREVASRLAQDAEATALLNELRNTRKAIKESEPRLQLPESREFYWSKIQRDIERQAPASAARERPSVHSLWRRILIPLSGLALVLLAVAVGIQQGLWETS